MPKHCTPQLARVSRENSFLDKYELQKMELHLQVLDSGIKGGYGEVFRARIPHAKTAALFEPYARSVFVIKEIRDDTDDHADLMNQIVKETGRLATTRTNINIPWAVLHTKRDTVHIAQICMDYHGRNLDDYYCSLGDIDLRDIITIVRDTAHGLDDLEVPHLDLKPQNILWNDTRAVLCDFGMSRGPLESPSTEPLTCTYTTRAPEILSSKTHGSEADLWSLGVTISWLVSKKYFLGAGVDRNIRQLPAHIKTWESDEAKQLLYNEARAACSENSLRALLSTNSQIPFGIAFAVLSLCQMDPKKRISIHTLLNTPWLRSDLFIKRKRVKPLPLYTPISKNYTTSIAWCGLDNETYYLLKPVNNVPAEMTLEIKNQRQDILSKAWNYLKQFVKPLLRDWISVIDIFDRLASAQVLSNHSTTKLLFISVFLTLLGKQHARQLIPLKTVAEIFFLIPDLADLTDGVWSALHQLQYQLFTPNVNTWFCANSTDKELWCRVLDAYTEWPNGSSRHGLIETCLVSAVVKFAWISKEKDEILSTI